MKKIEPTKQHRWLARLAGEWTYEGESSMGPGKPNETFSGTETVRTLGDLWTLFEARGKMPDGGDARMLMSLGYDADRGRFVGTWIGSMMTWLWRYDGTLDAGECVLTLESQGPSWSTDGELAYYRDVIEVLSDDERTLTSCVPRENGQWQSFMRATYRRKR